MKASRHDAVLVGVVTFVVVLGGVAGITLDHLDTARRAELARLRTAVEMLAPRAAALLAESSEAADAQIRAWTAASGLRVTLIAADGRVHADSWTLPALLGRLENHLDRPEVQAALRGATGVSRRRSATTDRPTTYVARMLGPAQQPLGFLRLATESRPGYIPWGAIVVAAVAALSAAVLTRHRLSATHAAVARHLRPWTDLPPDAGLEVMAEEAIRRLAGERDALALEIEATRIALAQLEDGVVLLDRSERVRFANPAAVALLGHELPAGRPLVEAVRAPEVLSLVRDVLISGRTRHTTASAGGRELLLRASAFEDRAPAVAVVIRDMSGQRNLERARRALVADLAHELRTPLTVLGGLAEEMRLDQAVDPDLLATLDRQVRRLGTFAKELEDLARIESGQVALTPSEVDLLVLAREVAADHRHAADAAGVALEVDGTGAVVTTDRERLAQVLSNLLDNAIRYNRPGGQVRIAVAAEAEGARIRVDDTGLGIPAADVPLVFQRFYRVHRGGARHGSGLGLAIVKHLVQALGGTVQLASQEGQGTQVAVALPATPPSSLSPPAARRPEPS
ncbi:MAG TPA: ATP-binding protein [Thermoanaerobaculaceae bacterium]|nr:ATP-binding protein [Thermoanaerobaculaceae bacterium]HRS14659.1 ATP-binding protein [Thermoanaerobaculaceae bacterium]